MPSVAMVIRGRSLAGVVAAALLVLLVPVSASAHSELKSSDPADGASVPSPFSGPLVLTFSEDLADGSKADLVGPDGSTIATASIDSGGATMTVTLPSAVAPGAYQVKWTSIAADGDLLRGIVTFSVAATTPSPPQASVTAAPSGPVATQPEASATAQAATPAATPATSSETGGSSDVILPIAIALIVAAAGVLYLARRNRPA